MIDLFFGVGWGAALAFSKVDLVKTDLSYIQRC